MTDLRNLKKGIKDIVDTVCHLGSNDRGPKIDLSIEKQLASLVKYFFPDASVSGEEAPSSTLDNKLIIQIDPIDGSSEYYAGGKNYCNILSKYESNSLTETLLYLPEFGRWYHASRLSHTTISESGNTRLLIPPRTNNRILTYGDSEVLKRRYKDQDLDLLAVTSKEWDSSIELNTVLNGSLAGLKKSYASGLDWAPIAFLVQQAGGITTDFNGIPLNELEFIFHPENRELYIDSLICSWNKEIHNKQILALNN